jgi:hypothetical protein
MGATTVDARIAIKSSRTWFGLNARRLAYVGALTVNIVRRVVAGATSADVFVLHIHHNFSGSNV